MKKNMNNRTNMVAFILVVMFLLVGGFVLYYRYMNKQQMQDSVQTPTTETEKLIAKDLEIGYPETPVEVMKLWGRLNQCIYNTSLGEEQFKQLLLQLRFLYSKELLEQNPEDDHLKQLKAEVSEFQSDKNKISSYSTDTGVSVSYKTIQKRDSAKVRISYLINLNRGKGHAKLYQQFILVKEEGKWKILGFKEEKTEEQKSKKK